MTHDISINILTEQMHTNKILKNKKKKVDQLTKYTYTVLYSSEKRISVQIQPYLCPVFEIAFHVQIACSEKIIKTKILFYRSLISYCNPRVDIDVLILNSANSFCLPSKKQNWFVKNFREVSL